MSRLPVLPDSELGKMTGMLQNLQIYFRFLPTLILFAFSYANPLIYSLLPLFSVSRLLLDLSLAVAKQRG
ncbi:hypothetical protein V6N11_031770 [Hibiscus sabdariffa]|uniref:Uncharacterized protein n=1 Tax=Hibiscus sabdariffa TaxID=183260 RepID=A0ABR2SYN5_9ROSI